MKYSLRSLMPKRSWFQFSLKTLLLAMLVFGCLIAPIAYKRQKAEQCKAAVERLEAISGEIGYDDAVLSRSKTLVAILGDNKFENVTSIQFPPASSVNDDDLKDVSQFIHLKWVRLDETRVTDATLKHLKDCRELKLLSLYGTRVSDAGLGHLADMTKVEELWLGRTDVTDAGLSQIGKMAILKTLTLHRTNVTDQGAEELQKTLPNCKISR